MQTLPASRFHLSGCTFWNVPGLSDSYKARPKELPMYTLQFGVHELWRIRYNSKIDVKLAGHEKNIVRQLHSLFPTS